MKLVITMSRRSGTGASIIANELSVKLGIPVYDKTYIEPTLEAHEYEDEAEAIRKLAGNPCIILGRCASHLGGRQRLSYDSQHIRSGNGELCRYSYALF